MLGSLGGGLQTALLLARGRPEGLARLIAPPAEPQAVAARSFLAILLCLPLFLLMDVWDGALSEPADLAADLIGYVIGWVGFAVLSWDVVAGLGRGTLWWRYIAAWNWSNVAQHGLWFAAALVARLGAPEWAVEAALVFAAGWALWIEWYATRLTLSLSGVGAAALVLIDFMVGLLSGSAANIIAGN